MSAAFPPDGYVEGMHAAGTFVAWRAAAPWTAGVLGARTLHAWAEAQPDRSEFPGRGRVFSVPAPLPGPDGRSRWAVRHYRRGGAMAMHLDDRYLRVGRSRPYRELVASCAARERGIRTPAVIAGATHQDGIYERCDLVTEVVPDVRTLADMLQLHDGTRDWLVCMARAGDLIRSLAEAGVYHVDLNARNVLLSDDGGEPGWVVDLDRARVTNSAPDRLRDRMELRLVRSVMKIGTPTGESLAHGELVDALATRADEL